ncbi:hypothetical protein K6V98_00690 [Collinsella sp. AGMB00827]|uniref:YtxH domain-containing protein n=1 Tax=Collinsella ureilytica TaxID=2869515 RepID=A0ABS7MHQ0_9ACTN|nr:hypothetical protein [Collinsella urealyticum]MBY4796884.1 hypothetical protein [Collinsella urealyticum]
MASKQDGASKTETIETSRQATQHLGVNIDATQPIPVKQTGLLSDISLTQLFAGAGAAATSVLLASRLGVYGSVIGAAISSVVTVIATQLYRRALAAGARRINRTMESTSSPAPGSAAERLQGIAPIAGTNVQADAHRASYDDGRPIFTWRGMGSKAIIFSIIAAILAVALSAGAILFFTRGEGVGERPKPVIQVDQLLGRTSQQSQEVPGISDTHKTDTDHDAEAQREASDTNTPNKTAQTDENKTTQTDKGKENAKGEAGTEDLSEKPNKQTGETSDTQTPEEGKAPEDPSRPKQDGRADAGKPQTPAEKPSGA